MLENGRARLSGAQPIARFPFGLDADTATIRVDLFPAVCLEHSLPRQSHAIAIVAQIHDPLLHETFPHLRPDALEYRSRIADRRLATRQCGGVTVEVEKPRKHRRVRVLVVREYLL